jgi:2-desacetyl-2-hydroxyethyl bacteriochlorophyllide A dehydrogenase
VRRLIWRGDDTFQLEEHSDHLGNPGPREVLLRVKAVGICGTDIHILDCALAAAKPPLVLGHEIAGEVLAVGERVQRVRQGDRVTVDSVVGCGHCEFCRRGSRQFCAQGFEFGITRNGGCQDLLEVPEDNVYPIPDCISDEEAAILDMEVWAAVRKCGIHSGERVLILGCGPAGMVACQVARLLGAGRILLSVRAANRLAAAERLGLADRYLCSAQEDVVASVLLECGGTGADIVIDCAGTPTSARDAFRAARPGGRVLLYGVYGSPLQDLDLNQVVLKDLVVFGALSDRVGWEEVIRLVASGSLNLKSLITHHFPLERAVEAYDLVRRRSDGVIKAVLVM